MTAIFVSPRPQFSDANKAPYAGGKLYFYDAGTSTPRNVFSDSALTVPITQPVILDAAGAAPTIFMSPVLYRVQLTRADDVLVFDEQQYDPGAAIGGGIVQIVNGGTGATSAAAARANLGLGGAAVVNVGIGPSDVPSTSLADTRYVNQAGDTMSGNLVVSAANPLIELNKTASSGQNCLVAGRRDNLLRWHLDLASTANEAGGNSGSNAAMYFYDDTGAFAGTSWTIPRTTGIMNFTSAPTVGSSVVHHDGNCGRCRAWVNFNGTGTPAIRSSFNVSSITDNAVGDYTINFTSALPDADFCAIGTGESIGGTGNTVVSTTGRSTTTSRVLVASPTNILVDATFVQVAIFR